MGVYEGSGDKHDYERIFNSRVSREIGRNINGRFCEGYCDCVVQGRERKGRSNYGSMEEDMYSLHRKKIQSGTEEGS